jgi:hypothetical protein
VLETAYRLSVPVNNRGSLLVLAVSRDGYVHVRLPTAVNAA